MFAEFLRGFYFSFKYELVFKTKMRNFSSKKQIAEENAEFFLKKRILMDLQLK